MLPKEFNIGSLTFHTYGFILAIAIFIGWRLAKLRAHIYGIKKTDLESAALLIPLFLAVVFARLYHVIHYLEYYQTYPSEIIKITSGGLGIWGGLVGMFIGFWAFSKIRKINFLNFLDLITPSVLLGQAIGRVANYINQEGFGPPTDLPWRVFISAENRPEQYLNNTHFHPTFFYEGILEFIFALILLKLASKTKKPGFVLGLYLLFYSTSRFVVEFFRIDTWQVFDFKMAHVFSLATLLIGISILKNKFYDKKT